MIDRTVAPLVGAFPDSIKIQQAEFQRLKNGIPLFILRAGTQPVVKIELLFPNGGNIYEKKLGQSFFTNKLINSGTSDISSAKITKLLAEFGTAIEISPSFDHSSASFMCLEKHVVDVLPLFISVIRDVIYPQKELDRERDLQITNLKVQNNKTSIKASKQFRNALFTSDHPYGHILNEDDIKRLTVDDLKAFHLDNLSNIEVLVTGSFSTSTISYISNRLESEFSYKTSKNTYLPSLSDSSPYQRRYPMSNSVQCSIRMGKRIAGKAHNDYITNLIITHTLGGYFGSRLMKNIREEKGLTYGIYSSIVNLKEASYFVISTDVKETHVDDAVKEINKELNILQNHLISQEELQTVKNHMLGNYQSDLNSVFALTSKFKNIHLFGLDYTYYDQYLDTVKSVTPEDILENAQKYLGPKSMTQVIVGGSDAN